MPNARMFSRCLTPALGLAALILSLNGCANKPNTPSERRPTPAAWAARPGRAGRRLSSASTDP